MNDDDNNKYLAQKGLDELKSIAAQAYDEGVLTCTVETTSLLIAIKEIEETRARIENSKSLSEHYD